MVIIFFPLQSKVSRAQWPIVARRVPSGSASRCFVADIEPGDLGCEIVDTAAQRQRGQNLHPSPEAEQPVARCLQRLKCKLYNTPLLWTGWRHLCKLCPHPIAEIAR